jgi:sodium-dependent dicarboxylate transporter 2/3/5
VRRDARDELSQARGVDEGELEAAGRRARRLGLLLGPLAFLALLTWPDLPLDESQREVAAVTALCAIWWTTLAVPVGATSLLPAALFPLLGVMGAEEVAPLYLRDIVLLFLSAMLLSLGLERWNVHRRLALGVIARVGTNPARLVLGFMIATTVISLFTNNTATTLLVLPIGTAVIERVRGERRPGDPFAVAMVLAIAYSASVGGMGTPIGTAPNQVFLGQVRERFPDAPPIGFGAWCAAWLPLLVLWLTLGWLFLTRVALRVPRGGGAGCEAIRAERARLGRPAQAELLMGGIFALTALAWITRSAVDLGPWRFAGWGRWFGSEGHVSDATIATVAALACFVLPSGDAERPRLLD